MSDNLFKWRRQDSAWHLWRGVEATDGAVIWQETGYVIRKQMGGYIITYPDRSYYGWATTLSGAKREVANLAQNSR